MFGADCPVERNDEQYSWFAWEQRIHAYKADGDATYSPEWVPRHGTRTEFIKEFRGQVVLWLQHTWRERFLRHPLRLFEDRKSGRHVVLLRSRVNGSSLRADALGVVVKRAAARLATLPTPEQATALSAERLSTLTALARLAEVSPVYDRPSVEAVAALQQAELIYAKLANTVTVQSDYAALVETKRIYTGTCATMERHNMHVSIAGFGSYVEAQKKVRFRGKKLRQRLVHNKQNARFLRLPQGGL